MAKTTLTKDTTDIAWLVFATFGVATLTFVCHFLYRDLNKILKTANKIITSRKRNKQKRRIIRLLERYADEDLEKIVFSVAAWPREGYPDKDLFIKRPPHYRMDLKTGLAHRKESENLSELTSQWLDHHSRDDLISMLQLRLSNRSLPSLTWLEQCLVSGRASDPDQAQNGVFNTYQKIRRTPSEE